MRKVTGLFLILILSQNSQANDMANFLQEARANASTFLSTSEEALANIRLKLSSTNTKIKSTVQNVVKTIDTYTPDLSRNLTEMVTKGIMNYSIGYRVGTITSLSADGIFSAVQSGEGTMFLGEDSNIKVQEIQIPCPKVANNTDQAVATKPDPNKICTTKITINPWHFSYNIERKKLSDKLAKSTKRKVIVSYHQPLFQHNKIYKTSYLVDAVNEIDNTIEPGFTCTDSRGFLRNITDGPNNAETTIYGLIVKLAYQGDFINTWEVLVQENQEGGDFHHFSVHDDDMVNCIHQAMSSGRPVELKYESLVYQPDFRGETQTNVRSVVVQ